MFHPYTRRVLRGFRDAQRTHALSISRIGEPFAPDDGHARK
jgi:hypothetical protein